MEEPGFISVNAKSVSEYMETTELSLGMMNYEYVCTTCELCGEIMNPTCLC